MILIYLFESSLWILDTFVRKSFLYWLFELSVEKVNTGWWYSSFAKILCFLVTSELLPKISQFFPRTTMPLPSGPGSHMESGSFGPVFQSLSRCRIQRWTWIWVKRLIKGTLYSGNFSIKNYFILKIHDFFSIF